MHFAGLAQGRQEGGERCAVVFGNTSLEGVGEGSGVVKAVQYVEHAEPFTGVGRDGEHADFHTCFEFFVGFGHVLRQGFFAGREEQQTPLLYLSACLATIIGAGFTGAVAEHVDRFANDARVAHADFVEYQEAV